uniref:Cytosolic fatty-acid binding proteins domain-containing protein n=1 Tax=Spermophilus dauricus TaxID=99837 RepID=A0A8C9UVX9_SPEDA
MAFSGKFELESEKNYDEFMKRLGEWPPDEVIEKARNFKTITEIQQNGQDFIWAQSYSGGHIMTNKFTIGKESEIQTMGGKKFKVRGPWPPFPASPPSGFLHLRWGLRISTVGGVTYERVSKRVA